MATSDTMLRRWMLAVALIAAAAALAGIDGRATAGARTTADEPQYLLTAQSIADDLDIDIADEIESRAYLPYHEIPVDRQTSVLDDGREVSPHDPLLPTVLAVPVALAGWAGAKALLAVVAGATAALTLWVAVRRVGVSHLTAGVTVATTFVGIPLAPYGSQVYPELPAALAVVGVFALITDGSVERRHTAAAIALIVALPWLAVKYVPVAAVLAVGLVLRHRNDRRAVWTSIATLGLGGVVYLGLHRLWYGGWTVYASGDHFEQTGEFSVVGTDVDLIGRTRRLTGLLVDREFGIGVWSPIWLLAPFAVGVVVARRPSGWRLLVGVVAAGWLNATFVALTMHGWWVPGRQVVVVLPLLVIVIAVAVDRSKMTLIAVALAGVAGAVNWVWLAVEASTGRRTLVVDFMDTAAWPYRAIAPLFPSGLRDDPIDTALLAAWSAVLLVTSLIGWRHGRRTMQV